MITASTRIWLRHAGNGLQYCGRGLRTVFSIVVRNFTRLLHGLIAVLLLASAGLLISATVRSPDTVIEPIAVPASLEHFGFSPHAVSRALAVGVQHYVQKSGTTMPTETVALHDPLLEFIVPGLDFSITSLVLFLRDAFGIQSTTVYGEISHRQSVDMIDIRIGVNRETVYHGRGSAELCGALSLIEEASYHVTRKIQPIVLATYHYKQNEPERARELVANVLQSDIGEADFVRTTNLLGAIALSEGKFEEAIRKHRRVLAVDPSFAPALVNLGVALANRDPANLPLATKHYKRAIDIDPTLVPAYINWGVAMEKQRKLERAISKYRIAAETDRTDWSIHLKLANALREKGAYEDSIDVYETAADLDPHNRRLYEEWASAYERKGDAERAKTLRAKAKGLMNRSEDGSPEAACTPSDFTKRNRAAH